MGLEGGEMVAHPSGMDHHELQRLHHLALTVLADMAKNAEGENRFKAADHLAWYTLCQLNKAHDDERADVKEQKKEWEK